MVKPERPEDALFPLAVPDPLEVGLPLAVPTVGAAVGGDRIGVPGPTEGICQTVPPGKTVIGIVEALLVPRVTTVEVMRGVVRVVKELMTVGMNVSTTVEALTVPPAPGTIEVTIEAPGGSN